MFGINWLWLLASGVGNNEQLLTAFIWVLFLKDRDVNQVVRSDVIVQPLDGTFKDLNPFHTFVFENLDVVRAIASASEPRSLVATLANVLSGMRQAQNIAALTEVLEFAEERLPWGLCIKDFEVNSVKRGVSGVLLAVFAVNDCNDVIAILFSILRHA